MQNKPRLPRSEVMKLLEYIDPVADLDAATHRVIWALANEYGQDEGADMAKAWRFLDQPLSDDVIDGLCANPDERASINHVIYLASLNGYRFPSDEYGSFQKQRQKRKAGQVALEDIFAGGISLVTVGDELYQYSLSEGYYQKISDGACKKVIADYFNTYETRPGETGFALNRHSTEALQYVKSRFHIDPSIVNPSGINLANGILQLSYDDKGSPKLKLVKHSPDSIFTYKSPVEYNPDADDSAFIEMIASILPEPEQQEILFRTVGASMDLPAIRKKQGRAVRSLFLQGEGSNGKDTLRECLSQIYGGQGVTSIPLQAFKTADKDRSFGLYPLVHSKINWSSENVKVSIDNCQALKNVVSGDEITIEEKHKQGFAIRPQTVLIFNLNESPAVESKQEAIQSRYALLRFQSVFKANPDPAKPWEKKADPRFKDDPDYLRETILPAFLNRVIQGFMDAYHYGVDYRPIEKLMEEVRESNSHLLGYIRESGLMECHPSEGIQTSKLYEHYKAWCEGEGLIIKNQETDRLTYNDPNPYDKVITHARQFTKRLKEIFPTLEPYQRSSGSFLPLRFQIEEDKFDI